MADDRGGGKTRATYRTAQGRTPHLLAALDHADDVVIGQRVVNGKSNEIKAFPPLLDGFNLTGAIVTADALHTQREHAQYLIGRGAHYLLTVDGNPKLHAHLKALPWRAIPAVNLTRGTGHSRIESRAVKITAVSVGIGFPHARPRRPDRPPPAAAERHENGRPRSSTRSPISTRPRSIS